jgi:hypothetical protein
MRDVIEENLMKRLDDLDFERDSFNIVEELLFTM